MKKSLILLVVSLWLCSVAATYLVTCKICCDTSCKPVANNVLRWVRDPNTGTLYYGWYAEDGSCFNCVGKADFNKRMGKDEPPRPVPVYFWERVN